MPQAKLSKAERKYLQNEAEPEARLHRSPATEPYGNVVIIPAMGETQSLLTALDSIPKSPLGRVLAIVVLNARESAADSVHQANAWARDRLRSCAISSGDLWVIDRAMPGRFLPEGEGVGLARKIGTDLAAALRWDGQVRSRFLHCTDADVRLPRDYFAQSTEFESPGESPGGATAVSMLLYRFAHELDSAPETANAILLYEIYLRYYVLGLRYAGSPYAFQTIGSTFAVDATAYAKVRGFPKRLAAEDFYLVNKLAKVGRVHPLAGDRILIEGRESDRVPFGTGKAVGDILEKKQTEVTYRLPHPQTFVALRHALSFVETMARKTERIRAQGEGSTSELAAAALDALGVDDFLDKLSRESLTPQQRVQRIHEWFDAFRTLKFLHWVRDQGLAPLPLAAALGQAAFVPPSNDAAGPCSPTSNSTEEAERVPRLGSLERWLLHLRDLEEHAPSG